MSVEILNESLIRQCQHRFRSLKAELADAIRNGQESKYKNDVKRLDAIERGLGNLQLRKEQSLELPALDQSTIELPVLSNSTRVEQKIMRDTLTDNAHMLERLAEDQTRIHEYLKTLHNGRLGYLKAIFALSWLRRRMAWTEKQTETVRSMRKTLEKFVAKLSSTRHQDSEGKHHDLLEAFREFEVTSTRILHLRSQLQQELAINRDQEAWLRRYDDERKKAVTLDHPPIPSELCRVRMEVEESLGLKKADTGERLNIALQLAAALSGTSPSSSRPVAGKHSRKTLTTPRGNAAQSKKKAAKGTRP